MTTSAELKIRSFAVAHYFLLKEVYGKVEYKVWSDYIKKAFAEFDIEDTVKSAIFYVGARHNFVV